MGVSLSLDGRMRVMAQLVPAPCPPLPTEGLHVFISAAVDSVAPRGAGATELLAHLSLPHAAGSACP